VSEDRPAGRFSARDHAEQAFADAGGALPRVREELFALAGLLRREARLRKTLADIAVPPEAKQALLGDLFGDRLDRITLSLVGDLVVDDAVTYRLPLVLEDLGVQAELAEADAAGELGEVAEQLFRFSRVVDAQPELRSALTDPYLPDDRKESLVQDLLQGKAADTTVLLARWAAGRHGDPAEALRGLADRAAARQQRVIVEARTVVPLDDDRRERLAAALGATTGHEVDVEVVIDPSVVGGVVARVGDEVIDGSIKRKLEMALERLTS
jgi:F-type H+-transporting ATPase subunit delta